MALPLSSNIEVPILHELVAVGGQDDVRFLYQRLISYFPSLSDVEIAEIKSGASKRWRTAVQNAGRTLDGRNLIRRERGFWRITENGKAVVENETSGFTMSKSEIAPLSHADVQRMLVRVGEILGFYAETEYEFYDVVWRESRKSQRISHVFEVQSKGNIDSAFAKLKRAFDTQRSKPFLILSTERDTNRAAKSLDQEFREIEKVVTVLSFAELRKIHENLSEVAGFLPAFLEI